MDQQTPGLLGRFSPRDMICNTRGFLTASICLLSSTLCGHKDGLERVLNLLRPVRVHASVLLKQGVSPTDCYPRMDMGILISDSSVLDRTDLEVLSTFPPRKYSLRDWKGARATAICPKVFLCNSTKKDLKQIAVALAP